MSLTPEALFPLIPVGKIVLNRNPKNFFAEVEQSAFSPATIVPGIDFSNDKMLTHFVKIHMELWKRIAEGLK